MSAVSVHPARVVQEQDSAVPPAQMAVQVRPPRSIPKALVIEPAMPSAIEQVILDHHYLHNMPSATRRCFAVRLDGELVGAVVFTAGARLGHRTLSAARPQQVATLARLWLSDSAPKNSESRVIGFVLRYLSRNTDWKLLLSYADPNAGHVGTIYQATGWLYLGQQAPTSYVDLGDGKLLHPRTVYQRLGSNAVGHLRRTGIPASRRQVSAKHRYAYLLDPAWRWRLRGMGLPYPKACANAPEAAP